MRTSNRRDSWREQETEYEQRRHSDRGNVYANQGDYDNGDYESWRDRGRGYQNPDYDDRNYNFGGQREELEWGNGNQQYVPEMDYGPRRRNPRTQVSGYGNQNSRFMNEFERWRNGSDNYPDTYGQSRYTNREDRERGSYRREDDYRQYDQHNGYNNRGTQRYNRNDSPDYNYYESYPSYGQGAPYNDHERGYIDKSESRGNRGFDNDDDYSYSRRDDTGYRRRFSSNEYDRQRRPMIRDKRY